MKKIIISFVCIISSNVLWGGSGMVRIAGEQIPLWGLIALLLFAFMFIHIIFDLLVKPFGKKYSQEYFEIKRLKSPELPPFSDTDAENCISILETGFSKWGYWDNDLEQEHFVPFSRKEYLNAKKALIAVEKSAPTSPDVIDSFKQYVNIYNKATTRKFDGSKTLIILTILFIGAMIVFFHAYNPYFVIGLCLFIAASCVPSWLKYKRSNTRNGAHISSRIIGGLFSATANTPTNVTVTKWSDGTVTKSSDESGKLFMIMISILCILIMVIFLPIIAFISYLRNYILYV